MTLKGGEKLQDIARVMPDDEQDEMEEDADTSGEEADAGSDAADSAEAIDTGEAGGED